MTQARFVSVRKNGRAALVDTHARTYRAATLEAATRIHPHNVYVYESVVTTGEAETELVYAGLFSRI